jgi:hypothetical protein
VEPARYRQEANYTAALVNRLEGTAYQGEHGSVVFHSTVFDDRAEYPDLAGIAIPVGVRRAVLFGSELLDLAINRPRNSVSLHSRGMSQQATEDHLKPLPIGAECVNEEKKPAKDKREKLN